MRLAWLSNPPVLWARTGLFNWWALRLLALKDHPSMLVFSYSSSPNRAPVFASPRPNAMSFSRDGVPTCRKVWQICWAESHPLKPIPSSVLAFPSSPLPFCSSIGYTLCLYSARPGSASAHTNRTQHHPKPILLLQTKQNLQGAGVKRAFSLLKVPAHL